MITYHRISKRTLHLVLLSKAGDFKLNSKLRVVPNGEHSFREVTPPGTGAVWSVEAWSRSVNEVSTVTR
jgi:hypothetical protein